MNLNNKIFVVKVTVKDGKYFGEVVQISAKDVPSYKVVYKDYVFLAFVDSAENEGEALAQVLLSQKTVEKKIKQIEIVEKVVEKKVFVDRVVDAQADGAAKVKIEKKAPAEEVGNDKVLEPEKKK